MHHRDADTNFDYSEEELDSIRFTAFGRAASAKEAPNGEQICQCGLYVDRQLLLLCRVTRQLVAALTVLN